MTRVRTFDRAAITIGIASLASLVFAFDGLEEFRFMTVTGPAVAVAAVLGALAVAAGLSGIRVLALLAGLGFAAAAVLQLVATTGRGDWLGADLSTMAFWLGLALALLLIGTAPSTTATEGT
ncbi:Rv1678 family membrane protein [Glycomyces tarimensis]